MERQRRFTRAQGRSASCILVKSDGDSRQTTLENISIGGALVKINEDVASNFNVGDKCTVTLCGVTGPLASHYSCEIVWCDSERLGIQFLTQ